MKTKGNEGNGGVEAWAEVAQRLKAANAYDFAGFTPEIDARDAERGCVKAPFALFAFQGREPAPWAKGGASGQHYVITVWRVGAKPFWGEAARFDYWGSVKDAEDGKVVLSHADLYSALASFVRDAASGEDFGADDDEGARADYVFREYGLSKPSEALRVARALSSAAKKARSAFGELADFNVLADFLEERAARANETPEVA